MIQGVASKIKEKHKQLLHSSKTNSTHTNTSITSPARGGHRTKREKNKSSSHTSLYNVNRREDDDTSSIEDDLPLLLQNNNENGETDGVVNNGMDDNVEKKAGGSPSKKKEHRRSPMSSPRKKKSDKKQERGMLQAKDLNIMTTSKQSSNDDGDEGGPEADKRSPSSGADVRYLSPQNDAGDADSSVLSSSLDSSTLNSRGEGSGRFTDSGGFPSLAVVMPKTFSNSSSFQHDTYFQFNSDADKNGAGGVENNVDRGSTPDTEGGVGGSPDSSSSNSGGSKGGKLAAIQQLTANLNGIKLDTLWESESLADSDTQMSTTAASFNTSSSKANTNANANANANEIVPQSHEFETGSTLADHEDNDVTDDDDSELQIYCVPGDISANSSSIPPVSPLTVEKKTCFMEHHFPSSPTSPSNRPSDEEEEFEDHCSRGSSDSAIDLLHNVQDESIQNNFTTVAGDIPFFQQQQQQKKQQQPQPKNSNNITASTVSTSISNQTQSNNLSTYSTPPKSSPSPTKAISTPPPPPPSSSPSTPTSYNATILLQRYEVNLNADALYLSSKEVVLGAHDRRTGLPVALKLMNDVEEFKCELEGRRNLDPTFVLPVLRAMVDWDMVGTVVGDGGDGGGNDASGKGPIVGGIEVEAIQGAREELGGFVKALLRNTSDSGVNLKDYNDENKENMEVITAVKLDYDNDASQKQSPTLQHHHPHSQQNPQRQQQYPYPYLLCLEAYNSTLADTLSRRSDCNIALARKITRDVVIALILLHTENKIHANLSTHSIVRVGDQWKIKDLSMSLTVGKYVDMRRCKIAYSPPEVATRVLEMNGRLNDEQLRCVGETEYDLWSLGTVLYGLLLGTSLWNSDSHGYVSSDDLSNLARWSPQSFLRTAYLYFPPDSRSDDERAAIDLISKLLMPTANDRKANFEFGIVSVHQHEFLENQPLEAESLVAFGERQAVMLRNETEHDRFTELTKSLSLEERWELNRSRDVLLTGMFETTDVHTPTSFVVLTEKLEAGSKAIDNDDDAMYARRLGEALSWIQLFEELGPFVRGSLDGDLTSVGHFWAKIKKTFPITSDYVYLYFIDDMTGEPVLPERRQESNNTSGSTCTTGNNKSRYPLEIKVRSDLFPKLIPIMQVTMRSMALYHGVAGIARMFGCPRPNLTRTMRVEAQGRTDALKDESSASPFGTTLDEDVKKLRNNREQFLKDNTSLRCRSIRELIRFLDRKIGCDFAGLKRLADDDGRAIWTTIDDAMGMKKAIQNRAQERLCEERNLWDDSQDWQIRKLQELLNNQVRKATVLTDSLEKTEGVRNAMEDDVRRYKEDNGRLSGILDDMRARLVETEAALEKEKRKMKLLWIKRKNSSGRSKKTHHESVHSDDFY